MTTEATLDNTGLETGMSSALYSQARRDTFTCRQHLYLYVVFLSISLLSSRSVGSGCVPLKDACWDRHCCKVAPLIGSQDCGALVKLRPICSPSKVEGGDQTLRKPTLGFQREWETRVLRSWRLGKASGEQERK